MSLNVDFNSEAGGNHCFSDAGWHVEFLSLVEVSNLHLVLLVLAAVPPTSERRERATALVAPKRRYICCESVRGIYGRTTRERAFTRNAIRKAHNHRKGREPARPRELEMPLQVREDN
jgi:hypothetical protein